MWWNCLELGEPHLSPYMLRRTHHQTRLLYSCAGDEIVEWNGTCLRGKTYEEVQKILSESNQEIEILADCSPRRHSEAPASARTSGRAAKVADRSASSSPQVTWSGSGRSQQRALPRAPARDSADSGRRSRRSAGRTNAAPGEHGGKSSQHGRGGNSHTAEEDGKRPLSGVPVLEPCTGLTASLPYLILLIGSK